MPGTLADKRGLRQHRADLQGHCEQPEHTAHDSERNPPLRQGQTRYPFLVMQFKKDEEVTIDLNMTDELLKEKYEGKLMPHYEQPLHQVVTQVFRGLTGKKVNQPAKDFLR